MSAKKYQIIRRSHTKLRTVFDFQNRNYNVPLVGCDNYILPICVNDVISVKFKDNSNTVESFKYMINLLSRFKLLNDDDDFKFLKRSGNYRREEEHLFKVVKVKGAKIDVKPVFIDNDKIIVKEIRESFNKDIDIPSKKLFDYKSKYEICKDLYEKIFNKSYEFISEYSIDIFLNNIQKRVIKLPYKNYKNLIIDLSDKFSVDMLNKYFDYIHTNEKLIKELFTEENLNNIGSLEQISLNMDKIYNEIMETIGDKLLCDVRYFLSKPSHLDKPMIKHNINRIKYADIFRVYKTDLNTKFIKTMHVTNWSGIILDENIRNLCTVGNTVRISLKYNNDNNIIYVNLIHKFFDGKFLACIHNKYDTTYEDIVFIMNTGCITEIPTDWFGNELLKQYDKTEGIGYTFTGFGSLKNDDEQYELNYDGLILSE